MQIGELDILQIICYVIFDIGQHVPLWSSTLRSVKPEILMYALEFRSADLDVMWSGGAEYLKNHHYFSFYYYFVLFSHHYKEIAFQS